MARSVEAEGVAFAERGEAAIELAREAAAGENGIEQSNGVRGKTQRAALGLKFFGELGKDAMDFRSFVFGELHELVIELDGVEGLDENGLPGGARAVDHAGNGLAVGGAHGNDEAVVAQRDVVVAGFGTARGESLSDASARRRGREQWRDGFS